MTRRFNISAEHTTPKRWWLVTIHPDPESLQDAAHRYRPHYGRSYWDGVKGCCHPVPDRFNPRTGTYRYPANGFAGVLRFHEGGLNAEITAHEITHAALATYRMNVARYVQLGDECRHREETLAYILGSLNDDLAWKLQRRDTSPTQ